MTSAEESPEPRTTGERSLEPEAVEGDSLEPETVKGRRRGGRGSRMRRLLAYQLQLSVEKGLPLSRLLKQGTDARSPKRRGRKEQEGLASPTLRKRPEVKEKEEERIETGEEEEGEVRGEAVGDTGFRASYSKSKRCYMLSSSTASRPTPRHHSFPQIWGSPPFPSLVKLPCTPPQQHIFCVSCQFWGTLAPFPQTSVM